MQKNEIAGQGSLNGVLEAVCGLKFINLRTYTIKILGFYFSYNRTLKMQNNFLDTVESMKQVLRFWNSRILSLEGRVILFKTLTIFKIVPNLLIEELKNVYMALITSKH